MFACIVLPQRLTRMWCLRLSSRCQRCHHLGFVSTLIPVTFAWLFFMSNFIQFFRVRKNHGYSQNIHCKQYCNIQHRMAMPWATPRLPFALTEWWWLRQCEARASRCCLRTRNCGQTRQDRHFWDDVWDDVWGKDIELRNISRSQKQLETVNCQIHHYNEV